VGWRITGEESSRTPERAPALAIHWHVAVDFFVVATLGANPPDARFNVEAHSLRIAKPERPGAAHHFQSLLGTSPVELPGPGSSMRNRAIEAALLKSPWRASVVFLVV
jgi:hypothetical protein